MMGKDTFFIRRFDAPDAESVSALIGKTLKISNASDYSEKFISENIASHSAEVLIKRAQSAHSYVACRGSLIVGCGSIDGYFGSREESILLTIFVLPEYQKKGIGRQIIRTLEADEYFLRAKRIEIPASVTAVEFYKKMGYSYKNGVTEPDAEGCVRLEKFR